MSRAGQAFRAMVRERGDALRMLSFEELATMTAPPAERVLVGKRKGTIAIHCERNDDRIVVVLRGDLSTFIPAVKRVERDGFYKHRDGSVAAMHDDALYDYEARFPD